MRMGLVGKFCAGVSATHAPVHPLIRFKSVNRMIALLSKLGPSGIRVGMSLNATAVGEARKTNLVIPAQAGIHNTAPYGI
jgi:hypothetical protein